MRGRCFFVLAEIRNGPRHTQNPLVRASRKIESFRGAFEQRPAFIVETTGTSQGPPVEQGVRHSLAS